MCKYLITINSNLGKIADLKDERLVCKLKATY